MLGLATAAKLNDNAQLVTRVNQIKDTRAQAVRRYLSWDHIEKVMGSGQYDWSHEDVVMGALARAQLKCLLGISARMDDHALDEDHLGPNADFAKAAVERYGGSGLIIGIEGPNELMLGRNSPNGGKYDTNPTADRYVRLQGILYDAVKSVNPAILMGTGSFIGDESFLVECYAAGMKGLFDFLCWHPYTKGMSPRDSLSNNTEGFDSVFNARQVMLDNGDGNKQVWATEYGSNRLGRDARGSLKQASDLHQAVAIWQRQHWTGPFFWFTGWDDENPGEDPGESMGLYTYLGTKNPSFFEFQKFLHMSLEQKRK